MAMLRSAIRLAFRQSEPASRFFGNVGRRNPPSCIISKRNIYFNHSKYEFVNEDFPHWGAVEYLIGGCTIGASLLFLHNVRESRYNTAHDGKKSTSDTRHYGQEKAEKKKVCLKRPCLTET